MTAQAITWSRWNNNKAKRIVDESPHKEAFWQALEAFRLKANSKEVAQVCVWHGPFIYIEARHTDWQHYPCNYRALVSWDATNGKLASFDSANRYVFARQGWGRFMDDLVGYEVRRYSDCGQRDKTTYC